MFEPRNWQHDRSTVYGVMVIAALIALLCIFVPQASAAEPLVYAASINGKPTRYTLLDKKCEHAGIVAHGKTEFPHLLPKMYAATLLWTDGKVYAACYAVQGGGGLRD